MTRLALIVGARGFEPRTSPLSGVRSSQLSYAPSQQGQIYLFQGSWSSAYRLKLG